MLNHTFNKHPVVRHNAVYIQNQGSSFRCQRRIQQFQNTSINLQISRKDQLYNTIVTKTTMTSCPANMYLQEKDPRKVSTEY